MGLVDSHCHLNFTPLGEDLEAVLERAREAGVSHLLNVSVNLDDYPEVRTETRLRLMDDMTGAFQVLLDRQVQDRLRGIQRYGG